MARIMWESHIIVVNDGDSEDELSVGDKEKVDEYDFEAVDFLITSLNDYSKSQGFRIIWTDDCKRGVLNDYEQLPKEN